MNKFREILLLSNIRGIGPVSINRKYIPLISNFSSFEDFTDALTSILPERFHKYIQEALTETEKIIKEVEENNITPITVLDKNYPPKLKSLRFKAPPILYVKGNAEILSGPGVSVVGTRNPSGDSVRFETDLVRKLKTTVISGLAPGTDSIAHRVALEESLPTIAVLLAGLENVYPRENIPLAEEILQSEGSLITSYRPFERLHRAGYITRNQYVAALADELYVLQFSRDSGTMYTVNYARELNRRIFCYCPGNGEGDFSGNEFITANDYGVEKIY